MEEISLQEWLWKLKQDLACKVKVGGIENRKNILPKQGDIWRIGVLTIQISQVQVRTDQPIFLKD